MSSIDIAKKRRELEEEFQRNANLLTGQLTDAKSNFDREMAVLQKKCSHTWDTGESGIQQLDGMSICTICRKKFKIGGFDER